MVKNIGFLGKTGVGKSVLLCNLSEALARQGYRILLVGNSICMDSTQLLLGDREISPVLEDFRDKFTIDMKDYIVESPSGVFCMELGGLTPGSGCMARSLSIVDEMMDEQRITEELSLDYIFYDISGEIPCTGYILPIRDDLMDSCVVVTNGDVSSVAIANNIISGIIHARRDNKTSVGLLVNNADCYPTSQMMELYCQTTGVPLLAAFTHCAQVELATLSGKTVLGSFPDSPCAQQYAMAAKTVIDPPETTKLHPMDRPQLRQWLKQWQTLQLKRGVDEVESTIC